MQNDHSGPYRVQYSFGGPMTPAVKWLLIGTAAAFFIQTLLEKLLGIQLGAYLGVVPYFKRHLLDEGSEPVEE